MTEDNIDELRLYCVVRGDLIDSSHTGKWMAQAGHAFLGSIEAARQLWLDPIIAQYMANHQPKIVVVCKNLEALQRAYTECVSASIPCCLIKDLGRTVFLEPTITCLGIGPVIRSNLPKFISRFRLYE